MLDLRLKSVQGSVTTTLVFLSIFVFDVFWVWLRGHVF